jgi:hypothetical protein
LRSSDCLLQFEAAQAAKLREMERARDARRRAAAAAAERNERLKHELPAKIAE